MPGTDANPNKHRFYELFDLLVKKGEDREELEFWEDIFDSLSGEEQLKLLANFEKELAAL